MFYFNYLVGTWLLGDSHHHVELELSMHGVKESLAAIWQQLYFGSLVCAVLAALIGYVTIRLLWRLHILQHIRKRRELRKTRGN